MRASILALVSVAGCAHAPVGELRYRNAPPVWLVNDRLDVPATPAARAYNRTLYHLDGFFVRRATRAMEVRPSSRALDVNALDEVPDSTWFTNRIGVRDLTEAELRRGPNVDPSPELHRPWTITGAKIGGTAVGFVFEDATGSKFLLKFDGATAPEMETGAHIIGHRIAWAAGYNVPQDHLATIRRDDLVIAPDATKRDALGNKTALTAADVDAALANVAVAADGTIRVLASRYLPGPPIGPYAREGTRADDRNDVIPHERRRSLRGQYPIFAWINHTDMQEDNTLDAYVVDVDDPSRHHVAHYLIDFGKALGVMGAVNGMQTVGHTHRLDLGDSLRAALAFGLWKRRWEDVASPGLRGIGMYEVASYAPGEWRANSMYWPYQDKDRFDAFWGAKILIRFTRAQLTAIVDEAHYSDPRAAAYMVDTLIERQRVTARYWFDQVAPLDRFRIEPDPAGIRICFADLTLVHQLANVAPGTRYQVDAFDHAGASTGAGHALRAGTGGAVCSEVITPGTTRDDYTIVRLRVQRSARTVPAVQVHAARDAAGAWQVIGIRRD